MLHHIRVLYVQWHQNRMAGMWETYPNLTQKWPKNSHFSTFFDFLKNCPYDSNEIFYSYSTPYYGPLCTISLNSYCWDVRNIAKFGPKMAKKQSFFDFFDFLTNCSYDSNESESEGKRLKPTPLLHMRLWFLSVLVERFEPRVFWISVVQVVEQMNNKVDLTCLKNYTL